MADKTMVEVKVDMVSHVVHTPFSAWGSTTYFRVVPPENFRLTVDPSKHVFNVSTLPEAVRAHPQCVACDLQCCNPTCVYYAVGIHANELHIEHQKLPDDFNFDLAS